MIGIFGGTFDPIHFGHLRVALDVKEALDLTQIRFVPVNQPVHREQPCATATQRAKLIELAIQHQPGFIMDDRELQRKSPSWTLTTLQSLREDLPDKTFCLMIGTDAFNHFLNWHQADEILKLAHLVVMQRPGYSLPDDGELQAFTQQHLTSKKTDLSNNSAGYVYFQEVTQLGISSSDIRQRMAAGSSINYLLPSKVAHTIATQSVYPDASSH